MTEKPSAKLAERWETVLHFDYADRHQISAVTTPVVASDLDHLLAAITDKIRATLSEKLYADSDTIVCNVRFTAKKI